MSGFAREFAGRACAILALLAATAAVGGAVPYSDFEDGTLQGWTKLPAFNGDLVYAGRGGNPGGYMFCGDTMPGGGGLQARAPSDFTGDLSLYRGLQWDECLSACTPGPTSPTYPLLYAVVGGDTTIYRESNRQVTVVGSWQRRFVSFDADSWERVSGTASFDSAIHEVSMLTISMDCNTMCYGEAGVDNIMILGPDPKKSAVGPWDAYGHAFVSPGTQSGVDTVRITVRDFSGAPLPDSPVEIRFFDCARLCIDYPETGLSGTTDAGGRVALDPRVGGCDDCTIQVTADSLVIRTYTKVVSTDWNGIQADGLVEGTDVLWFLSAMRSQDVCGDYDGSGIVGSEDSLLIMAAQLALDANEYVCYPYEEYGACCLPGGTCMMTTSSECVWPSVWHGDRHTCQPNQCPQPQGACCTPDGICTISTQAECLPPNAWYGASSTCIPNRCPVPPPGACCTTSGQCAMTPANACQPPSMWHGEWITCAPNPCSVLPLGACCATTGECTLTAAEGCQLPSVWHGAWLTCNPNPCASIDVGEEPSPRPRVVPAILSVRNPMPLGTAQEICFFAPRRGRITLQAYDVTGALVCGIAGGLFEAGVHHVTWPGSDGSGVSHRSGAYLLRLTTPQGSVVRKVIRLR